MNQAMRMMMMMMRLRKVRQKKEVKMDEDLGKHKTTENKELEVKDSTEALSAISMKSLENKLQNQKPVPEMKDNSVKSIEDMNIELKSRLTEAVADPSETEDSANILTNVVEEKEDLNIELKTGLTEAVADPSETKVQKQESTNILTNVVEEKEEDLDTFGSIVDDQAKQESA